MVVPSVGQLMIEHGDVPVRLEPVAAAQERRADDRDHAHADRDLPDQPDLSRRPGAASPPASRRASRCTRRSQETGLFLPMLTSMVQVGEESGQLAQVMEQISPFFKEKMEGMVLKVTKMVEPIIIMGMGIVDRRPDAGDLHADVRHGGEGQMSHVGKVTMEMILPRGRGGPIGGPRRMLARASDIELPGHDARRGYTLVELMVSVVVMGVLISMAIPRFGQFVRAVSSNRRRRQPSRHLGGRTDLLAGSTEIRRPANLERQ